MTAAICDDQAAAASKRTIGTVRLIDVERQSRWPGRVAFLVEILRAALRASVAAPDQAARSRAVGSMG